MTGQQNDRDELRQKIHANYGLPVAVDAATLTHVLDQLDQAEAERDEWKSEAKQRSKARARQDAHAAARIKAVRDVLDTRTAAGQDAVRANLIRRALEG
ncbi:hypothetical protein [Pseudactinotalea sp.]|uniref:hypothetical protein n=1 Tax=Pseudactinotalea sp. TaxID=1926260 RepID=UPI003B3B8B1D